jgi:hypothetical protein
MMRILDNLAGYMCPHGGQVIVTTTNTRVKADASKFLLKVTDQFAVVGCSLATIPSPPCVKVMWTIPSQRVKVMGTPVLLESSAGMCLSAAGAPLGPVVVMAPQSRAKAL